MRFEIETNRLILRDFETDDLDAVQSIAEQDGFHFVLLEEKNREAAQRFVTLCIDAAKDVDQETQKRCHYRLAVTRKDDHRFIGYIGLFNLDLTKKDAEMGFFIDPRFQNQGYASEAAKAILILAKQKGLKQVYATVRDDNVSSRRVLAKFDFNQSGQVPNKYNDNVQNRWLMTVTLS